MAGSATADGEPCASFSIGLVALLLLGAGILRVLFQVHALVSLTLDLNYSPPL